MRAVVNSWMTSPPEKKRIKTTIMTVPVVRMVLSRLSLILMLKIVTRPSFLIFLIFSSLTRSKMTIVSLIEKPIIVKITARRDKVYSGLRIEIAPYVTMTSWNKATIPPSPYEN
jgi:hypothetical protein